MTEHDSGIRSDTAQPTTEAGRATFLRRLSRAIDDDRQYQRIVDEFDRLQAEARATADAEIAALREALTEIRDLWERAGLHGKTFRIANDALLADKPVGAGDYISHRFIAARKRLEDALPEGLRIWADSILAADPQLEADIELGAALNSDNAERVLAKWLQETGFDTLYGYDYDVAAARILAALREGLANTEAGKHAVIRPARRNVSIGADENIP